MAKVAEGKIDEAMPFFSSRAAGDYRAAFDSIGNTALIPVINQIGTITPSAIYSDSAEYYFEQTVGSQNITFPIQFQKENGVWKIEEF